MKMFKEKLPGITLALIVGLAGKYLANWFPSLGEVTLAIILGLLVGNVFRLDKKYSNGIRFVEKKLLSIAIMLMGLKLEMSVLVDIGVSSILIIIIMVLTTIVTGSLIGKLFGLSKSFSLLLGIGNGICGSSAIAATAPIISDNEEEIGLSVSVVNLLGTIGIFLLPAILSVLNFSEPTSGLMIGSTLQATGHVVAAGFSVSDLVGRVATIVKMSRILMLGPVVLFLSLFFSKRADNKNSKVAIPPFILGFFVFSIIGTLNILPVEILEYLKTLSKLFLTIAMAGVGLKIRVSSLVNQGPKALLVGIIIFAVQIALIISLISIIF